MQCFDNFLSSTSINAIAAYFLLHWVPLLFTIVIALFDTALSDSNHVPFFKILPALHNFEFSTI